MSTGEKLNRGFTAYDRNFDSNAARAALGRNVDDNVERGLY
jgi:hypothetical protein